MTANRISQLKEIISLEEKRAELQSKIDTLDEQIADIQNSLYNHTGKPAVASASKRKSVTAGARKGRGALRQEILEALAAAGPKGAAVLDLATLLNTKPANIHSWFSTNLKKTKGLKKVGEARYAFTGTIPAAPATAEAPASTAKPAKAAKSSTIVPLPTSKAKAPARKTAARATASAAAKPAKAVKAPKAPKAKPAKAAKAPKAPKATKATKAAKTTKATTTKAAKAAPAAAAKSKAAGAPAKRGALKAQVLDALKAAGPAGITITELSEKLGVKYKNLYIWFLTTGKRVPGLQRVGTAQYALS